MSFLLSCARKNAVGGYRIISPPIPAFCVRNCKQGSISVDRFTLSSICAVTDATFSLPKENKEMVEVIFIEDNKRSFVRAEDLQLVLDFTL